MKPFFARIFRYRTWANQQTLASLVACPAAQAEAVPLLAHILAAEHVWLARMEGREPTLPVWPTLSVDECGRLIAEHERSWAAYIDGLDDAKLAAPVEYRNVKGEPFRNTVLDILTQVATHGGYHRGQIAKIVGRCGGKAAMTDFIIYIRAGEPKAE